MTEPLNVAVEFDEATAGLIDEVWMALGGAGVPYDQVIRAMVVVGSYSILTNQVLRRIVTVAISAGLFG